MKAAVRLSVALVSLTLLAAAPRDAEVLVGRYAGTLPCHDCAGIETELELYRQGRNGVPTRYVLTELPVGGRRKAAPVQTTGRWYVLRGSALDPNDTVYELDAGDARTARFFLRVNEQRLRLLDSDQADIPAEKNVDLFAVPATQP